ncbi:hypothetical protein GR925_25610 [Streptomyces sp. HUCO-GS316]|uniref:hypothetical protein n=1 Tax=Streptomyces sp. HUCO-GS316 TaxID=2692198 RepID=UPI0013FE6A49|nr:hypothetical protein [Streptomyces sp. HUCO-GS316]MXM66715.1 hypothetical protein [Streptomyces sp. HUCO-GS316]
MEQHTVQHSGGSGREPGGEVFANRCTYVAAQVAVKKKYGLWVTAAERAAMKKVLSGCPGLKLPTGGNPTEAPARFHAD